MFDPVAAAMIAADLAVAALLQPERAARLNEFHARDSKYPDFAEVVTQLVERTWQAPPGRAGPARAIARAEQSLVVHRLIELGENDSASPEVRTTASKSLERLANPIVPWPGYPEPGDAHQTAIRQEIERFLRRPEATNQRTRQPPRTGSRFSEDDPLRGFQDRAFHSGGTRMHNSRIQSSAARIPMPKRNRMMFREGRLLESTLRREKEIPSQSGRPLRWESHWTRHSSNVRLNRSL